MFGSIGGPELLVIAVLALLLFGPRKLPEIGRSIGRALYEFRSATHEFKSNLEREVAIDHVRETREELASAGRELDGVVADRAREGVDGAPAERVGASGTESAVERLPHEPRAQAKS